MRMFVLPSPSRQGQMRAAVRLCSNERFVALDANLRGDEQGVEARVGATRGHGAAAEARVSSTHSSTRVSRKS